MVPSPPKKKPDNFHDLEMLQVFIVQVLRLYGAFAIDCKTLQVFVVQILRLYGAFAIDCKRPRF